MEAAPISLHVQPKRSGLYSPRGIRLPGYCALLILLLFSVALPASSWIAPALAGSLQAGTLPIRPYVYATVSSNTSYDVMLADGVNKDRLVARIKVDSVFFGTVSSRLSANSSVAAFRVSGDRLGGSSLHWVDLATGEHAQIAASKSSAESIGSYAWSPAGSTLAYVRTAPAPDPEDVDDSFGTVYLFSVGFEAVRLRNSTGNDRLLGFSGDGRGVYVSRREEAGGETLDHLVYLPISGEGSHVLLRSQPGFRYTRCAVGAYASIPDKFACLVEGKYSLAAPVTPLMSEANAAAVPYMGKSASPSSRVSTEGTLTRPAGIGLVLGDALGSSHTLVRRDAENFPYMAWAPDGTGVILGGTRSGASWVVDIAGNRRALNASIRGLQVNTWSADGKQVMFGDVPATRLVSLNYVSGGVAATRYVGVKPKPGKAAALLTVPYIHQVKDTAETADGNWACGPTSVAMALGYYGKLEPWSQMVANRVNTPAAAGTTAITGTVDPAAPPATATSTATKTPVRPLTADDLAPYITNSYSAYGRVYSSVARDPRGNMVSGLYGTICPTGLASWPQMISVLGSHGLQTRWVGVSWDGIVAAIKRGHPVLLGNMLTSDGHILLVVGYTPDGNLIVHDPYGNKFAPGYGGNDGNGIAYPWKLVTPRRALEVIGTLPSPAPK